MVKANGQFYLHSCIFGGPLLHIHVDSQLFSCMDTNNVALEFSPSLLPIVVHELLSNLDFILCIFFF